MRSLNSKVRVPLLFFLFLIDTFKPNFSVIDNSKAFKLASLEAVNDLLLTLKILTRFSVCLTDSFFSMIFLAINSALSNPIKIFGNENSNSAIYINSYSESRFKYCDFTGLSALNNNLKLPLYKDTWETSSAITLFESKNISFDYCSFNNNRLGDDMINVVSCDTITFKNCSFNNILSDALDSDFSNVIVNNCQFHVYLCLIF